MRLQEWRRRVVALRLICSHGVKDHTNESDFEKVLDGGGVCVQAAVQCCGVDPDTVMTFAATGGHIEIVRLCRDWLDASSQQGVRKFDEAMTWAAESGHIDIVLLCRQWGARDFETAMAWAALGGHIEIVRLCRDWGAQNFDWAMADAAANEHSDIVALITSWQQAK